MSECQCHVCCRSFVAPPTAEGEYAVYVADWAPTNLFDEEDAFRALQLGASLALERKAKQDAASIKTRRWLIEYCDKKEQYFIQCAGVLARNDYAKVVCGRS